MKNSYLFLIIVSIAGCTLGVNNKTQKTEKFQKQRDNIINVSDKISDIKTDLYFSDSELNIIGDYLLINDWHSTDIKGIHLYNKKTFDFITSTAFRGRGPGEISSQGRVTIEPNNKIFWVPDHGKRVTFQFYLDSVLNNELYLPTLKKELLDELFLDRYDFLNDSTALGKAVHVVNFNAFDMAMAKLNLKTNTTEKFGYEHPESFGKKSNSYFALSRGNNLYVNAFVFMDLITICDLDGNLKYNIYGPGYINEKEKHNSYFQGVEIWGDKIIASYNGDADMIFDEKGNPLHGNYASKFLVFDLEGNYLQTLEAGFKFSNFCVDAENKRIIIYFQEREEPLGYINLNLDELKLLNKISI